MYTDATLLVIIAVFLSSETTSSIMAVLNSLIRVQKAAEAQARGDPAAHGQLLQEIHNLQLEAETPAETTMRMRFQVRESLDRTRVAMALTRGFTLLQILQNLCVRIAIEYKVLQAIAAGNGSPVTAAELAQTTQTDELMISTWPILCSVALVFEWSLTPESKPAS